MAAIVQAGANQPLSFTVGDDVSLRLTVTENSVAYSWTGATVTTSIIANGAAVATNFTTTTSAGGILDLSLTDTETTTLGLGTFDYWVKVTKASVTSTWVAGQLTMHAAQYGSASNLSSSLSITTAASTTLAITLSGYGAFTTSIITALPAATAVTTDDLFVVVDDPAGTPVSKKVTAGDVAISMVQFKGDFSTAALDYTGATDSTVAFQAILTAAAASLTGGAWTQICVTTQPGILKLTGLIIPDGVWWQGQGTRVNAGGAGTVVTLGTFSRISGIKFYGGGASLGANGIVLPANKYHALIEDCTFDSFSGRAILLASLSSTSAVREVFAQNCLLSFAGLAAKTGVLEIAGTDHHVYGNVEVTASMTALSSVNAYACGVVVSGAANFLDGVLSEISDVGFYVSNSQNIFTGCRSDLNRAHGYEIVSGGGVMDGCMALRNGLETTNTYNGFEVTGGNWNFTGCYSDSSGGGFTHKYGFHDTQSSDSNKNIYVSCTSIGHGTAALNNNTYAGAAMAWPNSPPKTAVAGATPSVDSMSAVVLNNTVPTTVTNLLNAPNGQCLDVYGDGFSTLQHNGSTFIFKYQKNVLIPAGQVLKLRLRSGCWYEDGPIPSSCFDPLVSPILTAPAVPATLVDQVNTFPFNCMVYVSGGTVTNIHVGGGATGLTSGGFLIAAGGKIKLTYTVAPSWVWVFSG